MKTSLDDINIKNYPNLSQVFSQNQHVPLKAYSARLFDKEKSGIEPELLSAFKKEWQASGWCSTDIIKASAQLQKNPVIQTSHHITPTNGPTFLTLDMICLCGLKPDLYYLVGANSGVAFSNSAWTGALSYKAVQLSQLLLEGSQAYHQAVKSNQERVLHGNIENRYSLIPARQRDQLLYGVKITESIYKKYAQLNIELRDRLPKMEIGKRYNRWAVKSCEQIQKTILNQPNILYFNINQVITNYLIAIIKKEEIQHPVFQIFFGKKSKAFWTDFKEYPAFLGSYSGKKSHKVDQLTWGKEGLIGKKTIYPIAKPEDLLMLLQQTKICPAVLITFLILKFINRIRCLGSFNQIEYLENIRLKLFDFPPRWNLDLNQEADNMLTTGRIFKFGKPYWPLDLFIEKSSIDVQGFAEYPMIKFWQPIINQLS
jgi:hypothetical protein